MALDRQKPCSVSWCIALPETGRSRCKHHQQDKPLDQFVRPPVSRELQHRYDEETAQAGRV